MLKHLKDAQLFPNTFAIVKLQKPTKQNSLTTTDE